MTSTAPSLPSDVTWVDVPMEQLETEAADAGRADGKAAASYLEIDSESGARRLLALIEDGDPAIEGYQPPAPLSGECADDLTPLALIRDVLDLDPDSVSSEEESAICTAYEQAFYDEWSDEVSRRATAWLAEDAKERESELLANG